MDIHLYKDNTTTQLQQSHATDTILKQDRPAFQTQIANNNQIRSTCWDWFPTKAAIHWPEVLSGFIIKNEINYFVLRSFQVNFPIRSPSYRSSRQVVWERSITYNLIQHNYIRSIDFATTEFN